MRLGFVRLSVRPGPLYWGSAAPCKMQEQKFPDEPRNVWKIALGSGSNSPWSALINSFFFFFPISQSWPGPGAVLGESGVELRVESGRSFGAVGKDSCLVLGEGPRRFLLELQAQGLSWTGTGRCCGPSSCC